MVLTKTYAELAVFSTVVLSVGVAWVLGISLFADFFSEDIARFASFII